MTCLCPVISRGLAPLQEPPRTLGNFQTLEYIHPQSWRTLEYGIPRQDVLQSPPPLRQNVLQSPGRTYSRVRPTRVWRTLEYVLPRVRGDCHTVTDSAQHFKCFCEVPARIINKLIFCFHSRLLALQYMLIAQQPIVQSIQLLVSLWFFNRFNVGVATFGQALGRNIKNASGNHYTVMFAAGIDIYAAITFSLLADRRLSRLCGNIYV